MRCAIMQPTYFPWAGYFNLISRVDAFVFLDDVQFLRQSWHNRNRVLLNGAPHWLSVPVERVTLGRCINEVVADDKHRWRDKHVKLLRNVYSKHPHGKDLLSGIEDLIASGPPVLADLNIRIITALCARLGIGTRLLTSSSLGIAGRRTGKVIAICEQLGADEYLSPPGSADYLAEDGFEASTRVALLFNQFEPQAYPQRGAGDFVSHLSIIDIIANIGWQDSARYIRGEPAATEQKGTP